jgi:hypothetical protein
MNTTTTYPYIGMTWSERITAEYEAKAPMNTVRHTPEPESQHWYTKRPGGRWYDGCKTCQRGVVWGNGRWSHTR